MRACRYGYSVYFDGANPLGDEVIASATINRLIHHIEVIARKGVSYRTRHHTKRLSTR